MYDPEMRKDCPMRGNLGNCSPVGGFCVDAVSDEICEAVHNAYEHGFYNAVRMLKEQEPKLIIYTDNPYTGQPVSHCPKCGKVVRRYSDYDDEAHYCPWCGQAVKWE